MSIHIGSRDVTLDAIATNKLNIDAISNFGTGKTIPNNTGK